MGTGGGGEGIQPGMKPWPDVVRCRCRVVKEGCPGEQSLLVLLCEVKGRGDDDTRTALGYCMGRSSAWRPYSFLIGMPHS